MDYELIELRRSRSRKADEKSRARQALENALFFVFSLCMVVAIMMFFGAIWLTDPAYGCTRAEVLNVGEGEYIDLCQVIAGETTGEPFEGQKAVVEVIANRVMSEEFPDTVQGVLSQKGQFCTWKHRNKYAIMQSHIDAVEEVRLSTESVLPSEDYIYFCTIPAYKRIGKKYMHNVVTIGNHVFGTKK